MARWSQRSYWKVVNGVREQFGLTLAEARAAYRHLADRLDRPVFGTDLAKHPRIVYEEVRDARLEIAEAEIREMAESIVPSRTERQRFDRGVDLYEEEYDEDFPDEYDDYEITATTEGDTPRRK